MFLEVSEERLGEAITRWTCDSLPRVAVTGNFATPWEALRVWDKALGDRPYRLFMMNAQRGIPTHPGVTLETAFVGSGMRGQENLDYYPCRLSLVPKLVRETVPPDVVIIHTSRVIDGKVSLGTEVNMLPSVIELVHERGGCVIAQINEEMPYTYGAGEIPVSAIDHAIKVDIPLDSPPDHAPTPQQKAIATNVASLISDGDTLQSGIGAVPDLVIAKLTSRRNLRVFSEMFGDGVMRLDKAGALDQDVPIVASFAFGSQELYDWLDCNPRVQFMRTETTNDPAVIAQQPGMVSICGGLQLDLFDQVNASVNPTKPGQIYSGFGGATDYLIGALHAPGGKAVVAMPAWNDDHDVSTIVPELVTRVTSTQHTHVATEFGVAEMTGATANEQTRRIIEIADPRARESLTREAKNLGLVKEENNE